MAWICLVPVVLIWVMVEVGLEWEGIVASGRVLSQHKAFEHHIKDLGALYLSITKNLEKKLSSLQHLKNQDKIPILVDCLAHWFCVLVYERFILSFESSSLLLRLIIGKLLRFW
jgi:hypothetical protein